MILWLDSQVLFFFLIIVVIIIIIVIIYCCFFYVMDGYEELLRPTWELKYSLMKLGW